MIIVAEAHRGYAAKQHLSPTNNWHRLADNAMHYNNNPANASMDAFRKVQLKVETNNNLYYHHEHQNICEGSMDVLGVCLAIPSGRAQPSSNLTRVSLQVPASVSLVRWDWSID